ncbi:uncharacterized protein LOC122956791 [Acropora millepora]|uniref:uncharacterized protein LOC122956791 n=1 Tax=Acropora millepora TaxID=45264 RepID=UPI001CF1BF3E|nr:uncharacterized protein LOC122956791 [Acropora millepora]
MSDRDGHRPGSGRKRIYSSKKECDRIWQRGHRRINLDNIVYSSWVSSKIKSGYSSDSEFARHLLSPEWRRRSVSAIAFNWNYYDFAWVLASLSADHNALRCGRASLSADHNASRCGRASFSADQNALRIASIQDEARTEKSQREIFYTVILLFRVSTPVQKLNIAVVVLVCWTRLSLFLVCFCIPAFPVCFHTPLFFDMCTCLMYESYEMPPKLDNVIKSPHYFRNVNLDEVQIKFNNNEKSRLWIPFLS